MTHAYAPFSSLWSDSPGHLLVRLALLLWVGYIPTVTAQSFSAPTLYYLATGPQGVALADVNGDAHPDLITTVSAANAVSVLLNHPTGSGTFSPATTYSNVGGFPVGVVVRDVNGDARPDLVLALQYSGGVGVLLNSALTPGIFLPPVFSSTLGDARSLAVGDVNGDSRPDIVALNLSSGQVGVLLNSVTTPGTFPLTATLYATGGTSAAGIALGDVNGDGRLDIVVCGGGTGRVGVLFNQASAPGTFALAATYASGGSYPQDLTVGDINADGRLDIVVATGNDSKVGVLLNSAGSPGTFPAAATTYSTGNKGAYSIVLGDVNGDGLADIVTGNYNSNTIPPGASVGVLLNSSVTPGLFPAVCTDFATGGASPHDVALGDVDSDGRLDIATVNYGSATVAILRNTGTFLAAVHPPVATVATLYPNPAHERFTLEVPPSVGATMALEVVNALGQVVHQQRVPLMAAGTSLLVEVPTLAAGLYLLRLSTGPITKAQRLLLY